MPVDRGELEGGWCLASTDLDSRGLRRRGALGYCKMKEGVAWRSVAGGGGQLGTGGDGWLIVAGGGQHAAACGSSS
jgi:hypothetical protein